MPRDGGGIIRPGDERWLDPGLLPPLRGTPDPANPRPLPFARLREGAHVYFEGSPREQASMRRLAQRVFGGRRLLTEENPKLTHSTERIAGMEARALMFAPAGMSGYQVCPCRTLACEAACLAHTAGHGVQTVVRSSRVRRVHDLVGHPHLFFAWLDSEVERERDRAARQGKRLGMRLNASSDITWEHVAPQLFGKYPDVDWYDYTKIVNRWRNRRMAPNYHLTLSSTGLNHKDSNWLACREYLDHGGVVAMAFNARPKWGVEGTAKYRPPDPLPSAVYDEETGKHYPVIDGDWHDFRHLDHELSGYPRTQGLIAGLRFKGGTENRLRALERGFAVPFQHDVAVARAGANPPCNGHRAAGCNACALACGRRHPGPLVTKAVALGAADARLPMGVLDVWDGAYLRRTRARVLRDLHAAMARHDCGSAASRMEIATLWHELHALELDILTLDDDLREAA